MPGHQDVNGMLRRRGYQELKKVGEGSFGKALLVKAAEGQHLICKMVDVSKATTKEAQEAAKEAQLLSKLRHPYIVRYCESFSDSGWLCILMDYCEGGDLAKQISDARKSRKTLQEEQVLKWFTQAILALKYIHDQHILHRDLKPQNFFLAKNGVLKMGDFGIAKVLACTIAVARTQIGTPYYLSPELCQEKPYAWPADIWSMGCILYEMCALKVPFDAPNIPGLVQKIVRGAIPAVPSTYSSICRQLVQEMLDRNPQQRPGTDDILKKPQIQGIVRKMLENVQLDGGGGDAAPAAPGPSLPASAMRQPSEPSAPAASALEGPYKEHAGQYHKDALVEYNSSAHKSWLPARVIKVDSNGKIVIDLKPNTWISREEQATKVRPRQEAPKMQPPSMQRSPSIGSARGGGAAAPSPRNYQQRVPSAGPPGSARGASPMMRRSPSVCSNGGREPAAGVPSTPGRCASPMQRRPSYGGGVQASPSSARSPAYPGGRPPSLGASPSNGAMAQQSPGFNRRPSSAARGASPLHRSPSPAAGGAVGPFRVGELVEYHSVSHKEWLPATVLKVDDEDRVVIDLKPNTWISKEEQASKLRRRKPAVRVPPVRPSSRGASPAASPLVGRRQSSVDRSVNGGFAGGSPSSGFARAASPRRVPSRDGLGSRGGSVNGSGDSTPGVRPPGIPRAANASPLRCGGRSVLGS
eukprot:TRINITY_DN14209_c4_g1_i1.p1 TRINITY_DN14209_c4_g1~~TRINITY_DN14209_c4_g1_i1.p1  ORF type:complete len:696 (-),score=140.69 TRINITY_DN14209_c4_g1_i1:320-2407(-)